MNGPARGVSAVAASSALRWHRVGLWDLSPREQVLFIADGRNCQYKVARSGTADKPRWWLYIRRGEMEECQSHSHRLRDVKSCAQCMEANASASD